MLSLVFSIENQLLILSNIKHLKNLFNKIYIVGDTNLNLTDFETNIKIENYLNLLFQKNVIFAS